MIEVTTIEQAIEYMNQGYCILSNWREFQVEETLRKNLQYLIFSRDEFNRIDIVQSNNRFYRYCWSLHEEKQCEECHAPLYDYSATYISHILSRSNYPEYAQDPRNHNLLCKKCHSLWESPKNYTMLIYPMNMIIIKTIKNRCP